MDQATRTPGPATPLLDALLARAGEERVSFHMPGHAGGRAFATDVLAAAGRIDTTELPVTDDLHLPTGPARAAMERAAAAFGAARTFFLTTGSTSGLLAMITAAAGRGPLLLPRPVHRSIVHALALTGIPYQFLPIPRPSPDRAAFAPFAQPAAQDVRAALEACPEITAVLVTSPDYYGTCADLAAIAEVVHRRGALLLVDEAHGAHFRFAPELLPVAAMDAGADVCVQSAHKTLPALTQAALLHLSHGAVRAGRVDPRAVQNAIALYQTSSPSFLIAASIDAARDWMEREGARHIRALARQMEDFVGNLPEGMRAAPPRVRAGAGWTRDPLRLVVDVAGTGMPATGWRDALSARKVDVEMADWRRLVGIPALDAGAEPFARLLEALRAGVAGDRSGLRINAEMGTALDASLAVAWADPPERGSHPRERLLQRQDGEWTALDAARGRIAAEALVPYPPGLPLVWPGEVIDARRVEAISRLLPLGIEITGVRPAPNSPGRAGGAAYQIRTIPGARHSVAGERHV